MSVKATEYRASAVKFTVMIVLIWCSRAALSESTGDASIDDCVEIYSGSQYQRAPADSEDGALSAPVLDPRQDSQENNKTIGDITATVRPIFNLDDPKQQVLLFKLANYLHVLTHKKVITDDLLIERGDDLNVKLVEASERILNGRRYLGEASVSLINPCDPVVDVHVEVRDVWTLKPNLNFSKSSDESELSFGLEDSNFLGTGKTILVNRFSDAERSGNLYQFVDPNLGSYDAHLTLSYADNDDGRSFGGSFSRPFIDPSTEWSAGVSYFDKLESRRLYNAGDEALRYRISAHTASVFAGKKFDKKSERLFQGNRVHVVNRITAGVTRTRDLFLDDDGLRLLGVPLESPSGRVNERAFSWLWLDYERLTDNFVKLSNVRQINRPEYFNIGFQNSVRLAYTPTSIRDSDGKTSSAWQLSGKVSHGLQLGQQIVTSSFGGTAHYGNNRFFSSFVNLDFAYYWNYLERAQLHLRMRGTRGINLQADQPLILGGDSGIRGYPSFYQAGDRRAVFTLEQRFFGRREWFSLFHAGAAVFADVGRAWGESFVKQDQTDWLRDFGLGLRISGTRTGNRAEGAHTILHIDLVAPLDGDDDESLDSFQWRLTTETHF